ncbi:unnamed protein product [Parascedosporium putredinis]|uniref:Uncharacterized protein n=1 Tax=Parascedosporium putredinis TaxID=1442378 RepID=A0A9P1GXI2_9PEZI|nr:unnamed protein product [Parascedosporium putredinis]CAI7989709.1 unnamed protein product [Parascedosporium putredinis]
MLLCSKSVFRHSNEETSDSVAKKNALRDLIRQALRTDEVVSRTAVWARLSSAVSRLPLIIDELEEILESYQSVPWESELPWPELLTERVTTLSATLSTLAVLGCKIISKTTFFSRIQ